MAVSYCTLASGSAGNSAFVRAGSFGLLIDAGLNERLIGYRLASIGCSWRDVNAVLLTHAHSDHWTDLSLGGIRRLKIPFYCHPSHESQITKFDGEFEPLRRAGLVRSFEAGKSLLLDSLMTVTPIPVPHDSDPTFAFRIDGLTLAGQEWSIGHASDLGECPEPLFELFGDLDLLALEFNHDVSMQRASGRPKRLIDRVLGSQGHLSNEQAGDVIKRLAEVGKSSRLKHLVQLHLSRDCNTPELAAATARRILKEIASEAQLTTASQGTPSPVLTIIES